MFQRTKSRVTPCQSSRYSTGKTHPTRSEKPKWHSGTIQGAPKNPRRSGRIHPRSSRKRSRIPKPPGPAEFAINSKPAQSTLPPAHPRSNAPTPGGQAKPSCSPSSNRGKGKKKRRVEYRSALRTNQVLNSSSGTQPASARNLLTSSARPSGDRAEIPSR